MKPYNREYYKQQINNFNSKSKLFHKTPEDVYRIDNNDNNIIIDNIKLTYQDEICGRIDGYLYKNYTQLKNVPVLSENENIWMSVTPMEIDSHWIPINLANGKVGVAGLGLGYYIQNILDKPNVEKVVVYEINESVIKLYLENFGSHDKLIIKNQNALDIEGEYFDFFYNDIYMTLFCDDAIEHMKEMLDTNDIGTYFFWGMEGYILESLLDSIHNSMSINSRVLESFIEFYNAFENSEYFNLYQSPYINGETIEEFIYATSCN